MSGEDLTRREFHVLAHATGWTSRSPLYRNHYCAGASHGEWTTLQRLCERGLMAEGRVPGPLSGGDSVFVVTDAGIIALRGYVPQAPAPGPAPTNCPHCNAAGALDRPELAALHCTCTVCGWHYTDPALRARYLEQQKMAAEESELEP